MTLPDLQKIRNPSTPIRRSAGAILLLSATLFSPRVFAQEGAEPPPPVETPSRGITVKTSPPGARVLLRGATEIGGIAPLDLGTDWRGSYDVFLDAPGYATSRGRLEFSQNGVTPTATSEPPE